MLCDKCRESLEPREIPFSKGTWLRVPDATFGVTGGREFHARSFYGEFVELGNRHISEPNSVYVHPINKKGEPFGVFIMGVDVLEFCEVVPKPFKAKTIRVIAT